MAKIIKKRDRKGIKFKAHFLAKKIIEEIENCNQSREAVDNLDENFDLDDTFDLDLIEEGDGF